MRRLKIRTRSIGIFALGISSFTSTLLASGSARAATTIRVDSNCTIEQAFETLNTLLPAGGCEVGTGQGDTVELGNTTYNLGSRLTINQSATVKGHPSGASKLVAVNLNGSELFLIEVNGVSPDMSVAIQDVTLDGSQTSEMVSGIFTPTIFEPQKSLGLSLKRVRVQSFTWGGLYLHDSSLTLEDSLIINNASPDDGGGIRLIQGPLVETNSGMQAHRTTIASNATGGSGGGIYTEVQGTAVLTTSTLSGNFAAWDGGGVCSNNEHYLHMYDTTIAFNSAGNGGGGFAASSANSFVVHDSIVAKNTASGVLDAGDGYTPGGLTVSLYDTLIGHSAGINGTIEYSGVSLANVDPLLDSTAFDMGGAGHTLVHRLLPGSPALDYASTNNVPDQRGFPAPRDADGNGTKLRDIGAYEHDPNWQTEMLLIAAKSSDTHAIVSTSTGDTSTTYSNALGTNLQASFTNDFVTYFVPVREIGNYNVKVRVRKGSNRGKFRLAWSNNVNGPWTNIGNEQDLYSFNTTFSELNLNASSPTNIGSQGQKYFRFLVTGKNSQSGGYQLFLDTIRLTKL